MWISWTLGLQSIAQTSTDRQVFRMSQADKFFNEQVPNLCITVPMAHGMLQHQCHLQHSPGAWFTKPICKFVDSSAQGTLNAETMAQNTLQEHTTNRKQCSTVEGCEGELW